MIVGGCRDNSNNDTYTCVARAHNDGSIDLGFGDKGKAFGALRSQNFAVAIQTDSKIITTGECDVFFGSSQTFCTERRLGGPQPYRQCSLDIDGDGAVQATTDTLIATRVALGMIGASVLTGINLSGKPRSNWNDIREFLVTQCGMTIAP